MNVESVNLDHRSVAAPHVRVPDMSRPSQGKVVKTYDVRFCHPNEEPLDIVTVPSSQHMVADLTRKRSNTDAACSSMGFQAGFSLSMIGEPAADEASQLITHTLTDLLEAEESPAANAIRGGWSMNHSLEGAKKAVPATLDQRAWAQAVKA